MASNDNNFPCLPADLNQPCQPCIGSPCNNCEPNCECTTPDYEEDACVSTPTSDCTTYSGDDNSCVPLVKGSSITSVIQNLINYIKNTRSRILNSDGSIEISNIDDACDDKVDITVKIDPDVDNQLELTADGLFVPPGSGAGGDVLTEDSQTISFTGTGTTGDELIANVIIDNTTNGGNNILEETSNGLYVPPLSIPSNICSTITTTFTTDNAQKNGVDPTTYDFLIKGVSCEKVSPPLGFAVSGPTRNSAFGPMEFFSTLALATASATVGETILIYKNTSENITAKDGVNYFGIGNPSVGSFSTPSTYVGNLSNLIVTGSFNVSQSSIVYLNNIISVNNASFSDNSKTYGGRFLDNTRSFNLTDTAFVSGVHIERRVGIADGGQLNDFTVIDLVDLIPGASTIFLNPTTDDSVSPSVTNGYIYSLNHVGFSVVNNAPSGIVTISNIVCLSDGASGAYLHNGNINEGGSMYATNITARSSAASGLQVVSVKTLDIPDVDYTLSNWLVSNCNGYSTASHGISLINGNIKNCNGFSLTASGILAGGSENATCNVNITECTGESRGGNGLRCTRDCFVIGGSFISLFDDVTGNAILISDGLDKPGYYIAGVKTWTFNTTAYSIRGTGTVRARISGCQFLNQFQLTNVLGITGVTLRAVTTDIYGNIN